MPVELLVSDNIVKYTTYDGTESDIALILAAILGIAIAVLGIARLAISSDKASRRADRLDALYGRAQRIQLFSIAFAVVLVFLGGGFVLLDSVGGINTARNEVILQIEQTYGVEFTSDDEDDIIDSLQENTRKVKDADGNRVDASVEPAALSPVWVDTGDGLERKQYYFMITDRTDTNANFRLFEYNGEDYVQVEPKS